jgi:hypothetical protein
MKTKELRKLEKEFMPFLAESGELDVERVVSEFWFAKFGVSNEAREKELYEFIFEKDKNTII